MKYIKIQIILVFQLIFTIQLAAQFTPRLNGVSSFSRFLKTETYFVLSGNETIDKTMELGAREFWNITAHHFISEDSFALVSKDRNKSFVYIKKIRNQGNKKMMKALCLVDGGYDQKVNYISNTLAYISIDNEGYEVNEEDFAYRLGHIIYQLQDIVQINKKENFVEKRDEVVLRKYTKTYSKRSKALKNKTLLVDLKYLSKKIISKNEFENIYKYDLEFVKSEVIEKAIKEKDPTKAYLISAVNLVKINSVTDCATAEIIYVELEKENTITHEFNKNFDGNDIMLLNGYIATK